MADEAGPGAADPSDRVEQLVCEVIAEELALGLGVRSELRNMPALIADGLMRAQGLEIRATEDLDASPADDALRWPVVRTVTYNEVTDTAHVEVGNFNRSARTPSVPHQVLELPTPDGGRILVRLEDGGRIGRIEIWPASGLLPSDLWEALTEEARLSREGEDGETLASVGPTNPQVTFDLRVAMPNHDDRVVEVRATDDESTGVLAKVYRAGDELMLSLLGQHDAAPSEYPVSQFLTAIVKATAVLTEAPTPSE